MTNKQPLSESLEDYLKVILDLEKSQKVARAKDIAEKMNVQRGSVTNALKNLEERGLVNYEPYSFITLTASGNKIAREISHRHDVLKTLLLKILKIDAETAESTACRMEHAIDDNSLERLLLLFNFIYKCPRAGEDWVQIFSEYCSEEKPDWQKCETCIESCQKAHLDKQVIVE